jgi:acyl-CoA synthetase (AMP-forming)/AMP-acid ligase II
MALELYGRPVSRVHDLVAVHAGRTPNADALVFESQRIGYAELLRRIDALAAALLAAGVRRGDRVATLSAPHPDFLVTFLAAASIGAIWLGLNPRYRARELARVVADSRPTVLFWRWTAADRDGCDELSAVRACVPELRVVDLGGARNPDTDVTLEAFLARTTVSTDALLQARAAIDPLDPCLIVYTSGSTGEPKGALLHHRGIVAGSVLQNIAWPVAAQRALNYFPINHVGSVCDVSCPTLASGGALIFMEQFDARRSLELMELERVSAWFSVPSVFQMQLAVPEFERFDLSAVQLIVWEGAAMPVETIRRLRELVPRLATNYSMSESTTSITLVEPTDDLDVLADSVGLPFADVDVRLVDEHGDAVCDGAPGELQCRSPYAMLGYWERPEDTAAALADGWLHTGDLAVRRADGRYRLVGRRREMYKSGGYNVYPREVEAALEAHPAVTSAAVVARPDPLWQEVGVAFVIADPTVNVAALRDHCRTQLAHYKIPKHIELCSELPLLPIGKVDKVALRARALRLAD